MAAQQRRFLACMTALAVACAGVQALLGMPELALYFTPVLLVAGLLLCGRYVGEERDPRAPRRAAAGRPPRRPRSVPRPASSRPLASLLARAARRSSAGRRPRSRRPPDASRRAAARAARPTPPRRQGGPVRTRIAAVVALAALCAAAPDGARPPGQPQLPVAGRRDHARRRGVTVDVLNRDDRLLLHNTSGKDVVIEGYDGEPYARVLADGTVRGQHRLAGVLPQRRPLRAESRSRRASTARARRGGRRSTRRGASSGTTTGRTGWPKHGRRRCATRRSRRRSSTGGSRSRSTARAARSPARCSGRRARRRPCRSAPSCGLAGL